MSTSAFRFHAPLDPASAVEGTKSAGPAMLRRPRLTTTVPQEYVHRAAVAEVLLTGWEQLDGTRFRITAQLPRSHSFYPPVGGTHYDPLMVTEAIRQAGALLAHAGFDVPLGHQFLMKDMTVSVRPEYLRVGDTPAALDMDVTCSDVKWRRQAFAGTRYDAVIRRDGETVATGGATYTCMSPQVYRRVRGGRREFGGRMAPELTAPLAPRLVGRVSPFDVVLSPALSPGLSPAAEAGCWRLRLDTHHPILFDHPVDHVPGMVLLEAARQAATVVLRRSHARHSALLPVHIESEFLRYTEWDAPCVIEACRVPDGQREDAVLVTGVQNGEQAFSCLITASAAHI
ncbi:ScbA/BarX family gamma-butyrolactone biosynthesis protein [Streptomyces sp. NPDC048416]|uniref:ScbA/BarX family gamma-butyrolactone biosynthesis protein n=1 Tax=Streptomyces sp. NPDC048416 TaxID=3365546 RepID=UPI003723224F